MATNPNLPAGFFITTIEGKRCTAVPRALTSLPGGGPNKAAAQPPATNAMPVSTPPPSAPVPVVATGVAPAQPSRAAATYPAAVAAAPAIPIPSVPALVVAAAVTPSTFTTILTTTPTSSSHHNLPPFVALIASSLGNKKLPPSTPVAVAHSEVTASPTSHTGDGYRVDFAAPSHPNSSPNVKSTPSAGPRESSEALSMSSDSNRSIGPIIGGVVGALWMIALITFLFWFLRKGKERRESLLTPLNICRRSPFYDEEGASPVPTGRVSKWRTEIGYRTDRARNVSSDLVGNLSAFGASLRSKVSRDKSDAPNVNLNRGNSQFIDGPIPQCSTINSALSATAAHAIVKKKVTDGWERLRNGGLFFWRKKVEPADPFAIARSEKHARGSNSSPDFNRFPGIDHSGLQRQAEHRRVSLTHQSPTLPQLGHLGPKPKASEAPFVGPRPTASRHSPTGSAKFKLFPDPMPKPTNLYSDPPPKTPLKAAIPNLNTYMSDVVRSRDQSIDAVTPSSNHATATTPMYHSPSTISSPPASRDSYRDTVSKNFSENVRKGKGGPDPFDLERAELWKPKELTSSNLYSSPLGTSKGPHAHNNNEITNNGSAYAQYRQWKPSAALSKYSSGMFGWGDPGPGMAPRKLSDTSSLGANAGSQGGSLDYGNGSDSLYASLEQQLKGAGVTRGLSSASKASSRGGWGR
ncbi:uncharacterized protein L3040_003714 [Drepanopeziza brunnea f. sp. 'multigermtubi']|uniref:Uncharacterized protein n=1 Tax=Marssonina brunnea f. sp. multigermtubi (strain MB_m1) TaxID=1072389 RepID=K1WCJ9_MARBU|nr:uncharacterized protein MBM_06846 [Drepanopeziza brunnea f. sp. 'multigermtubi' MB_m1]EKD15085.1 hypothetical protein MBM_06846 [Drepanopeziza brunnea f. sp. 'multigermtubi' MB_m1]KAJ5046471.1 hypothetical protein L3040_003714 [Drepanopeziza brunnea f. sp. 'multigermtubi']